MIGALVLHGALLVGMGILYTTTYTFPVVAIGGKLGPTFWPRGVALLGIGLTLLSAYQTIRPATPNPSSVKVLGGDSERADTTVEPTLAMGRFWLAVAAFAIFIALVGVVGFAIAAMILAGFYIWLIGLRSKGWTVTAAMLIGLSFALLFGRVLQVSLPRGLGLFRELSYYLY